MGFVCVARDFNHCHAFRPCRRRCVDYDGLSGVIECALIARRKNRSEDTANLKTKLRLQKGDSVHYRVRQSFLCLQFYQLNLQLAN